MSNQSSMPGRIEGEGVSELRQGSSVVNSGFSKPNRQQAKKQTKRMTIPDKLDLF